MVFHAFPERSVWGEWVSTYLQRKWSSVHLWRYESQSIRQTDRKADKQKQHLPHKMCTCARLQWEIPKVFMGLHDSDNILPPMFVQAHLETPFTLPHFTAMIHTCIVYNCVQVYEGLDGNPTNDSTRQLKWAVIPVTEWEPLLGWILSLVEWGCLDVPRFGTKVHKMRPRFYHIDFLYSIWIPSSVIHLPHCRRMLLERRSVLKCPSSKIKIFLLLS